MALKQRRRSSKILTLQELSGARRRSSIAYLVHKYEHEHETQQLDDWEEEDDDANDDSSLEDQRPFAFKNFSFTTAIERGSKTSSSNDGSENEEPEYVQKKDGLKHRKKKKNNFRFEADVNCELVKGKKKKPFAVRFPRIFNDYIAPLLFIILSFYLRHYEIGSNNSVIWDEAHFAKFGSFYNKHTFYHDVHPPLGKMLCGLSEWLVGYNASSNPDYKFGSGSTYPSDINFYGMRLFQVFFSSAITPIAWYTCQALGMNILTTYLVTLMICLDSSFIVLGKFVLLDSFLFFFTGTTYLCLAQVNKYRAFEGKSIKVDFWYLMLGLSIGCVCSIKWVGLFVTAVVGIYTVVDLWAKLWDPKFKIWKYVTFWIRRIISLIIIPALIYVLFFKIHLDLLYLPGEGSGSMNTLFQANMAQTDIVAQPRFVQIDDEITLRSQGMNSNLLHSHRQVYPSGSRQHQVTTYGFKDMNNNWRISNSRSAEPLNGYLKDGDVLRLSHVFTKGNLHSHEIPAHVTNLAWEVSGYGDETIGDEKDDWIVEIVSQLHSSNSTYAELYEIDENFTKYVHPVSTTFRLRHKELGCYLGTTGQSYPTWGFQQGEVVCLQPSKEGSLSSYFDTSANWNIESVVASSLNADLEYSYPKSNFFKDFIQLQRSMAASNNALTPDPSKNDNIASSWWEWPIMRRGIRMSSWSPAVTKYYMFGNPITIWLSSLCVSIYFFVLISLSKKWRTQHIILDESSLWLIFTTAIIPLLGYLFHYIPFIVMGRVTYFHHYMPSLYFAIFMTGFTVDYLTWGRKPFTKKAVFFVFYAIVISSFWLFSPTCLGMKGPSSNYDYLNWLPTWEIGAYKPFSESAKLLIPYLKKHVPFI
jgi:dolichyl-phosphate-mannose-protein mannosyltransferase